MSIRVTRGCWRGSRAELQGDRKGINLVQVNVALVSTLILAVVCRVGERLPQPLLALRRLDQRLRQLLHAVQGRVISAPGVEAGWGRRRNTAHIGTPEWGAARSPRPHILGPGHWLVGADVPWIVLGVAPKAPAASRRSTACSWSQRLPHRKPRAGPNLRSQHALIPYKMSDFFL